MVFARARALFESKANNFTGKTTVYLKAVCAASALVAAADGVISDSEITATVKAVGANPTLTNSFDQRTISATADDSLKRAQSGRVGQNGLYLEIAAITSAEEADVVMLSAIDIAEAPEDDGSKGSIGPEEKAVLEKIASRLGVDLKNYL